MSASSLARDNKITTSSLWVDLPIGPHDLAYLDPPWRWRTWSPAGDGRAPPYEREALDNLKTLPLPELLAKDAGVAMWVIDSHLEQAFELAAHWGLRYSTVGFYWAKTTKNRKWHFGMGKMTRGNPEQCLLFWKGAGLKRKDMSVRKLIVAPVREHSRKPPEAREGLERLFGDVRRIELFARERAKGWETWGNQALQPYGKPVDNSSHGLLLPPS
jgi:N6-adenosine-specific RNA methylase IME4